MLIDQIERVKAVQEFVSVWLAVGAQGEQRGSRFWRGSMKFVALDRAAFRRGKAQLSFGEGEVHAIGNAPTELHYAGCQEVQRGSKIVDGVANAGRDIVDVVWANYRLETYVSSFGVDDVFNSTFAPRHQGGKFMLDGGDVRPCSGYFAARTGK